MYSQNGILSYIAMNFFLVTDAWALVSGLLAISVMTFVLSVLLPYSSHVKVAENNNMIEAFLVNIQILLDYFELGNFFVSLFKMFNSFNLICSGI